MMETSKESNQLKPHGTLEMEQVTMLMDFQQGHPLDSRNQ